MGASVLAADGYCFKEDYQTAVSDPAWKTLWVDDYGHCQEWRSDWVLNQNPHSEGASSGGEAVWLGGPRFALLREDLVARDPGPAPVPEELRRLLVTFGGADADNVTGTVLETLDTLRGEFEITVLAGAANPHAGALAKLAEASPHQVRVLRNVSDMAALYSTVDAVIGAGGSTCYEWLYFGLPGFVLSVADNQNPVVRELIARGLATGAAEGGKLTVTGLAASLGQWLARPMRPVVPAVDGMGAWRVAQILSGRHRSLRPARRSDAWFAFELSNEPSVRSAGFSTGAIAWDEHVAWLDRHLASPDSRIFVIEEPVNGPRGVVRMHRRAGDEWEIGISLAPAARGRGLARMGVAESMEQLAREGLRRFVARIRPENTGSVRLFEQLGFSREESAPDCMVWRKTLN